jgi:hypothetical protein
MIGREVIAVVDDTLPELVEVGRLSREPLHFAVRVKELHVEAMAFQFLAAFHEILAASLQVNKDVVAVGGVTPGRSRFDFRWGQIKPAKCI